QDGLSRSQQHHATTAKIYFARASQLSVAANRRAYLFDHVRSQIRFIRINFRNASFEPDDDLRSFTRRYRVAKVHSQSRALVFQRESQRRVVISGTNFKDVEPGFFGFDYG